MLTRDQILSEVQGLPTSEQLWIMDSIAQHVEKQSVDDPMLRQQLVVVEQRIDAYKQGLSTPIPWQQAMREAFS